MPSKKAKARARAMANVNTNTNANGNVCPCGTTSAPNSYPWSQNKMRREMALWRDTKGKKGLGVNSEGKLMYSKGDNGPREILPIENYHAAFVATYHAKFGVARCTEEAMHMVVDEMMKVYYFDDSLLRKCILEPVAAQSEVVVASSAPDLTVPSSTASSSAPAAQELFEDENTAAAAADNDEKHGSVTEYK